MIKKNYKNIILILLLTYILFIIFPGIPFTSVDAGLDNSWIYAVNYLAHSKYIFGQDIVFTYGPLGYLLHPIDISHNLTDAIIFWLILYIIFCSITILMYIKYCNNYKKILFILGIIFAWVFMGASFAGFYFILEYLIISLLILLQLFIYLEESKYINIYLIAIGVLSGLTLFMKMNIGIESFLMIIIYSLILIIRRNKKYIINILLIWIGYIFALIFVLIIHFKSLGNMFLWIRGSIDIVSGYSSAMSYGTVQPRVIILSSLVLLFYLCLIVFMLIKKVRLAYIYIIIAPIVYISLKESLVRQDAGHLIYYLLILPIIFALIMLIVKKNNELLVNSLLLIISLISILMFPILIRPAYFVHNEFSRSGTLLSGKTAWANLNSLIRLEKTRDLIAGQSRQNLEKDRLPIEWINKIGNDTIDVIPWEISYVPSNKLNWSPNPVLQSYSAYTTYLDNLSAKHFEGEKAPGFLIAEFTDIDSRHPLLDATATWRNIINNYKMINNDKDFNRLLLEKKDIKADNIINIGQISSRVNQWIDVPLSNNLLYAKIDIQPNLKGRITGTIYLIPPVNIELAYVSGKTESYRVISNTLRNGILLNYLPINGKGLVELFSGLANDRVKRFKISGSGVKYYSNDINVTWMETSTPVNYKGADFAK